MVPHPSGDMEESLRSFSRRQTPNAFLDKEPEIPFMTDSLGYTSYRNSIFERAGNSTTRHDLDSIWINDSDGVKLDNTIFLFQLDHGIEAKMTNY